MGASAFDRAWESLSPVQREVADWGDGPILVLAGPGSGKTRVLTCYIARLLNSATEKSFRVLGLTFTNKAADEMRGRVADFVAEEETRLFLGTFHSFCADVLRKHGTHLGIKPSFRIYSQDNDLQAVLNEAVERAKKLSDVVTDVDKKTLPVIHGLKSRLVFPGSCRSALRDLELGERMSVVYPHYEQVLLERNAVDFESLILKAYELFTTFPALAKRFRTVYPYICVDEFQDTNDAQYRFLRALTGSQHRNLFVVADDDQIIYQWNGASHKRLEELVQDYSPTVLQLPMNYRCPPEVVQLANNLIRHNFLRSAGKKPLESFRDGAGQHATRLLAFSDHEDEVRGVALDIKTRHCGHLGDVTILARSRKLLDSAYQALANEDLHAVISQRKDEFQSTPFSWLTALLRLANDRQDRTNLEAICGTFSQLTAVEVDPEDAIALARGSNGDYLQQWIKLVRKDPSYSSVKGITDSTSRCLGEGRDFQRFANVAIDWFDQLAGDLSHGDNDQAIEVFARYDEERSVWGDLVKQIQRSLGDDMTLEAFLQELQMRSKEPGSEPDSVVLMTIHGAKGKEFRHVYLIGLVEDELPSFQSKRQGDNSPQMEEERRNCFVAITRSMETLTLSYAAKYRGWKKTPSRFLSEMGLMSAT